MCQLTVDQLTGTRTSLSTPPDEVVAQGGADCDHVNIVFDRPMTADGRRTFLNVPVIGGRWTLIFQPPHTGLSCGDHPKISVSCTDDPSCKIENIPALLSCTVLPPQCPQINLQVVRVEPCDSRGLHQVTLEATITDASPGTSVYWDFGNPAGSFSAPHAVNAGTDVWSTPRDYAPGQYQATLKVFQPSGCDDRPLTIGPLPACGAQCPSIQLKIGSLGDCDARGRRLVKIGATVQNAAPGTELQLDYGDGTFSEVRSVTGNSTVTFTEHPYTPTGPYQARAIVISPQGCTASDILDIPHLEPCPGMNGTPPGDTNQSGGVDDNDQGTATSPRPPICRALEFNWMLWLLAGIVLAVLTLCAGTEGSIIAAAAAAVSEGVGGSIEVIVGYITLLLLLLTVGSILAALAVFVIWIIVCRPSDCRVWEDLLWVVTWAQILVGILIFICPHIVVPIELVLAIASAISQDYIASHGCHLQRPWSLPWNRD